jgi:CheY-like chemotaxis protein
MNRPQAAASDTELSFSSATRLPEENKSKVVFVVDDDTDTIDLVMSIGRRAGYTVFGATSGEECLSMLWRVSPQLIMLDVRMTGLDGFETCRRIRSDRSVAHVPIAFLTARKTVEDVKRCVAVGGDDFIVKPFDAVQLIERIEQLTSRGRFLGARRARRASKFGVPDDDESESQSPAAPPPRRRSRDPRLVEMASAQGGKQAARTPTAKTDSRSPGSLAARAERCSLKQIASLPLVPFLTHQAHHNAPGLISISVLPLWWEALLTIAHEQLDPIQDDLDRLLPLDDAIGLEALSQTLRGVVATLTGRLVALLRDPKSSHLPAVKALLRVDAVAELQMISEILLVAGPLDEAIRKFDAAVPRDPSGKPRVSEMTPALVSEAKRCYAKLGEGGVAGRLFVLAVLNRLDKPWQIFRLARALSWNRDASAVSGTELSVIGDRLFFVLDSTATAVDLATAKLRPSPPSSEVERLLALVARYADLDEGLINETTIRRNSPWGLALGRARDKMNLGLGEERLGVIARMIRESLRPEAEAGWALAGPGLDDGVARRIQSAINAAALAVRFLNYVAQRGNKHGFGSPARRVLAELRDEVAAALEKALEALTANSVDRPSPEFLERGAMLVEILLPDPRGQKLGSRLKAALGAG